MTAPAISQQPANTIISDGNTVIFNINPSGTAPYYYQWYKNGLYLLGERLASYSYLPVLADDGDEVYCKVADSTATEYPIAGTVLPAQWGVDNNLPCFRFNGTNNFIDTLKYGSDVIIGQPFQIIFRHSAVGAYYYGGLLSPNAFASFQAAGSYLRVIYGNLFTAKQDFTSAQIATAGATLGILRLEITKINATQLTISLYNHLTGVQVDVTRTGTIGTFPAKTIYIGGVNGTASFQPTDYYSYTIAGKQFTLRPYEDDSVISESDVTTSDIAELSMIEGPLVISKDDYFSREQPEKSEELVNRVEILTQPLQPEAATSQLYSSSVITLEPSTYYTLIAEYGSPPALTTGASTAIVNSGVGVLTVLSSTYYPWGAEVIIENNDSSQGSAYITIDGYALTVQGKETVIAEDTDSILDNGLQKYTYPNNHLIQDAVIAQQIATTLLSSYKQNRKDVNLNWRGNPCLELSDTIIVPEYERGSTRVQGNFKIYKNLIEFDGALNQITNGRKV